MATETRDLVCRLTEEEKLAYRSDLADLGIAQAEIAEELKETLLKIKAVKKRQAEILDVLKFGQEDSQDKDSHGRNVLVEIDADRRGELEAENLDLATQLEELIETRIEIAEERKAAKDGLASRLKALRYGQEERKVECEWTPDFVEQKSKLVRMDTGETVAVRPLSDEETQQAFNWERSKPRAMVMCPVCNVNMVLTLGKIDRHHVGADLCLGSGFTTQQAADYAGRLADYPKLPDSETLTNLRHDVAMTSYGLGREGIRTHEKVMQEREALEDAESDQGDGAFGDSSADSGEEMPVPPFPDDDLIVDAEWDDDYKPQSLASDSQHYIQLLEWDAASELPGYLKQLNLSTVADVRPGDVDGLLQLAGKHGRDLVAYLLAQPMDLKVTTKRALKSWGKE